MPDKEISTINNKIIYYEIQYQSTLYYENGEIKEKDKTKIITRYFDENNNVIKELPAAYNISYNIYEYDEKGNQTGARVYDENGMLIYSGKYTLDENGKTISTIGYNSKGEYTGESKIIYDFNGNMLQKINYDENRNYNNSVIFAYNDGKIYSMTQFTKYDDYPNVSIYSYNIHGRTIDIKTYHNGYPLSRSEILEYDEKGRETKSINYVYDFDGNEIPSTMNYYEYYTN